MSQDTIKPEQRTQYWLAALDDYHNAKLTDGPHEDEAGVREALYILQRLGLDKHEYGTEYAIAKVELFDVEPEPKDTTNEEALDGLARIMK
jgi:hypothetical protein